MSMNGSEYGGGLRSAAGQTLPTTDPDGRSREVLDTPASNRRTTAIVGLVLSLIPLLSFIGLIVSIVALVGYRKAGERGILAIIGIVAGIAVLGGSIAVLLTRGLG